jgi:hypothetical protein
MPKRFRNVNSPGAGAEGQPPRKKFRGEEETMVVEQDRTGANRGKRRGAMSKRQRYGKRSLAEAGMGEQGRSFKMPKGEEETMVVEQDRTEAGAMPGDEQRVRNKGGLPDPLRRMFAARNVIVAGETHGDPQTAEIEAKLLPALKVGVSYEGDTIKAPGVNVTPDPPAYRLLYYLEDFYELLHARMRNHRNPASRGYYDGQMNAGYERYLREFTKNYKPEAIEESLEYEGEKLRITYDRLSEFRTILFETLELIDRSKGAPGVYNEPLIQKNARDLDGLFNDLKKKSRNSPNEPVMRKLRSTMMYQALKKDLADGVGKRVYKVGNNHIDDIRAQFGNPAWVIDEAQYKRMLLPLNAKNNKGLTAFES